VPVSNASKPSSPYLRPTEGAPLAMASAEDAVQKSRTRDVSVSDSERLLAYGETAYAGINISELRATALCYGRDQAGAC